jgi:MoaA/NifB/PqqE/SkfB family radical SAM enzyme
MRGVLEVLAETGHPVSVVTKGRLVTRDADLLGAMGRDGIAAVGISITTLDAGLARAMEPRAAAPAHRLAAIRALTEAGCPVRVMVAPVVPGLTDHEIEAILEAARDAGAIGASYIGAAPPARGRRALARMARRARAAQGRQGHGPGARDARRPRLRPRLGQAHARRGRACRAASPAASPPPRAPRPRPPATRRSAPTASGRPAAASSSRCSDGPSRQRFGNHCNYERTTERLRKKYTLTP